MYNKTLQQQKYMFLPFSSSFFFKIKALLGTERNGNRFKKHLKKNVL